MAKQHAGQKMAEDLIAEIATANMKAYSEANREKMEKTLLEQITVSQKKKELSFYCIICVLARVVLLSLFAL